VAQGLAGSDGRAGPGEAQHTPQPQLDEWWHVFNDPALDQIVTEAQRANPGARTAGIRIMEARAQLGIAGSALYPQLQQVSGSVLRVGQDKSNEPASAFTSYGAGFDIAWEMDFWGRFQRGIEAADAGYFASIAQYDDVQVLVAAQAASLYASIRTVELRLHIAHENAALQQRSLEITERLFKSGNESELDVQQAKSLYLGTIAIIPELEGLLRQTQNALSVLLGRPPGLLPEMTAGRERIPEAGLDVIVEMPADLLRRRPDVQDRGNAARRTIGSDRRQRSRPLPIRCTGGHGRPLGDFAGVVSDVARLGRGTLARVECLRLRAPEKPGARAGCTFPATA
jgi:outer membrane protein TolC